MPVKPDIVENRLAYLAVGTHGSLVDAANDVTEVVSRVEALKLTRAVHAFTVAIGSYCV